MEGGPRLAGRPAEGPCAYCPGPGGAIDHGTAMPIGGSQESIRNWNGACETSDRRRGSRALPYFTGGRERRGSGVAGGGDQGALAGLQRTRPATGEPERILRHGEAGDDRRATARTVVPATGGTAGPKPPRMVHADAETVQSRQRSQRHRIDGGRKWDEPREGSRTPTAGNQNRQAAMPETETPSDPRGAEDGTAHSDEPAAACDCGAPAGTVRRVEITGVHPAGRLTYHPEPGVNIISGENGTGKSVLLKAMWHALTGRWPGTARTPGGAPMARMVRPDPAGAAGTITVAATGVAAPIELRANPGSPSWKRTGGPPPGTTPAAYCDAVHAASSPEVWIMDGDAAAAAAAAFRERLSGEGGGATALAGAGGRRAEAIRAAIRTAAEAAVAQHIAAGDAGTRPTAVALIDDAGGSMHPRMQRELIPALVKLGDALDVHLQIHAATHAEMVCAGAEVLADDPDGNRRTAESSGCGTRGRSPPKSRSRPRRRCSSRTSRTRTGFCKSEPPSGGSWRTTTGSGSGGWRPRKRPRAARPRGGTGAGRGADSSEGEEAGRRRRRRRGAEEGPGAARTDGTEGGRPEYRAAAGVPVHSSSTRAEPAGRSEAPLSQQRPEVDHASRLEGRSAETAGSRRSERP